MSHRRLTSTAIVALAVPTLTACADLRYQKVPTPTQHREWTDDDQEDADEMEGVRYYLPRPFLHLKQSTPVAQRVVFVSFRYSEKEKAYLLERPEEVPTWLKRSLPTKLSVTQALAALIAVAPGGNGSGSVQTQGGDVEAKTEKGEPSRPPTSLVARTGYINDADPVTRLDSRMDIVYLPDFEEQFVISETWGFGTVDIETRLRNGWAAEVFSEKWDNSNLIPYVIDQVEKASEAAAGIFTTWAPIAAGLPPGTVAAPGTVLGQLQSGDLAPGKAAELVGNLVLFKVAEVRVAQPGVYPILKPREVRHWLRESTTVTNGDPERSFELYLQSIKAAWIRPDMAFIPCPPVTMIGFNTTTDIFITPASSPLPLLTATTTLASGTPETTTGADAQRIVEILNTWFDDKKPFGAEFSARWAAVKGGFKLVVPSDRQNDARTHLEPALKRFSGQAIPDATLENMGTDALLLHLPPAAIARILKEPQRWLPE